MHSLAKLQVLLNANLICTSRLAPKMSEPIHFCYGILNRHIFRMLLIGTPVKCLNLSVYS